MSASLQQMRYKRSGLAADTDMVDEILGFVAGVATSDGHADVDTQQPAASPDGAGSGAARACSQVLLGFESLACSICDSTSSLSRVKSAFHRRLRLPCLLQTPPAPALPADAAAPTRKRRQDTSQVPIYTYHHSAMHVRVFESTLPPDTGRRCFPTLFTGTANTPAIAVL